MLNLSCIFCDVVHKIRCQGDMNIVLQGFGNENCMSLRSSQAASWMHKQDAYQPHVSFHISYIPLQMVRTWLFNEGACGA